MKQLRQVIQMTTSLETMGKRSISYTQNSSESLIKTVQSLNRLFPISIDLHSSDFEEKFNWFLVKAIERKDNNILLKISDCYSWQSRLLSPSIRELVNNQILNGDGVIALIKKLIENLAKFFGAKISGDLIALASILIKKYDDYSLADFIVFFDQCKQRVYADEFEHVSSRGITSEFLLKWIQKYDKARELEKENILKSEYKDSTFIQVTDSKQKVKFQELIQKNKIKAKIFKKHKRFERKESLYDKLVRYLSNYVLPFETEQINNNEKKINFLDLSKKIVEIKKVNWQKEFEKLKRISSNKEEVKAKFKTFTANKKGRKTLLNLKEVSKDQFIQLRMKEWLIEIEKQLSFNPQNLICKAIRKLIKIKQINQVEELIPILNLDRTVLMEDYKIDLETFMYWYSRALIEDFSNRHNEYVDLSFKKRKYPFPKDIYILLKAKYWINKLELENDDLNKKNS